ncbi:two-component regulator propeller domain-containing protein, partial [Phocaeicola vulgatus]
MSPSGGFYYDGIKAIEQDKEGFIWTMMDYELYRFDGYHYKKYYPYFASMAPTKRWIFNNMASDLLGYLYVNTNNGVYRYDRNSDQFEKIYDPVSHIKVDKANNVWIRIKEKWSILNTQTGELNTPNYDGKAAGGVNTAFCIYNNDLYTFIGQKVYRFNYAKNEFVFCLTLPDSDGNIRFAQAYMGKLWIFVNNSGLYKIDMSTFKIEDHYTLLTDYEGNSLRTFYIDKKGYIWFGTIDGIYIFDPTDGKLSHNKHSRTDPFSLPNNSIWEISEDRQGNIWIGTYSGTLCYVNIDENNAFKTYHPQNSGLNHTRVSAFAEDQQYLWVGTEGGGINRMNKATGEFSYITSANSITSNNIKSLITDAGHNLWISTFMGGLDLYNVGRQKVTNFKHTKGAPHSLLVNDVRKTILEGDSGMWVAYQYQKAEVSYFSFREESFTHFSLDSISNNSYLFDILRQGEKTLWAISNETLYRLDIDKHVVEKMIPNDSTYLGLFTFCLDDSGNIWIGTIGNGLIKFDTNTSRFISLKDVLQQSVYSIYSICYDDGNIWMGTDDGLYCYNIVGNRLMNFDKREDTQGQVYYPLACMKGMDGLIYFGGTNGFTVIDPKKISYNSYKPRAIISDFFIDHTSTHPHYLFDNSLHEIILEYDQTNFGFQFSSDNYHIPEKNRFKYRLRKYDDHWITTNAQNRIAMYSKVPAGTYYFEVYAANNDGVWSDTPTVIKVIRKTAPWYSWPAYILYALMIIGLIYLICRHYADKKKLKLQLYLENIEKDKKEQIHQAQLRFFTNISHDFRTPLSLIIAALDKLRREGLKEYYYRILNGNAQRLLNLVNELMDFRTVENGMMKLELQPLDINHIVKEIANDFIDYAEQRKIDFQVICDTES